jgi:hypothetical protein
MADWLGCADPFGMKKFKIAAIHDPMGILAILQRLGHLRIQAIIGQGKGLSHPPPAGGPHARLDHRNQSKITPPLVR